MYHLSRKTAIMDASSAIILYKAELHALPVEMYDIVLPASVYREITENRHEGAEEYKQLAAGRKLKVAESPIFPEKPGMKGLDTGERDVIGLFHSGLGEFIITDDGPAARYCKREGVPFINALLVPVILRFALLRDDDFCCRAMEKIIASGRYSGEVKRYARECSREAIAFALP